MSKEEEEGLYNKETYVNYARKCKEIVEELKYQTDYVQQNMIGWHVIGYGAAAKGMTLLNYSKIKLDFVIDDNPLKQGRFTPGAGFSIVSIDKLDEIKDTALFIPLAWNFFDEIRAKIKNKHDGVYDQFITYFPEVKMFK
jgi:C-methyltransferase C-terminal domain